MPDYRIDLVARNEGLRYEDQSGVLRFNVLKRDRTWTVALPATKEPLLAPHELTEEESALIYARIRLYLSRIWWSGFWPDNYSVEFRAKAPDA